MNKAFLIGIFSLLALAPFRCALGQAGSDNPAVRGAETSSAGVGSAADQRKIQDPTSEGAAGNIGAKNQATPMSVESVKLVSSEFPKAVSEAQRFFNTAVALHESGKLAEAISAFKEANRLQPNDPQTQYMLGMVHWKAKSFNEAVDSFKLAVRLKPDWAEAYFKLGLTYYVLGRKSQVNEAHKKLKQLNSPLADKLYLVIDEASSTKTVENLKPKPAASTPKEVEVVQGSASAAMAPLKEKTRAPAPVGQIANGDPAFGKEATEDAELTDIYKVGVGDVLDIRLVNSIANRSTLYSVTEGGLIDFPIAGGPIPVAGLTTKDIQARITSELRRLAVAEGTQVAVGVRQYASHTVIITGLVSSPGTKSLRREAVPLYVLLAEVQPRPDAARAAIMRAGAPGRVVDLGDSAALNFIIRPGDVINLTARPQDFFYIGGRVSNPGQKTFHPGITLLQSVLAAGGSAHGNAVELSREGSGGRLATTKFSLKEIKSGKIQDPKLQPGDRVEVVD